ncbi:MAG TPA: sugar phosphate isomerase/epimerase [Candidatus Brocadiia bacterium]|nr:sugar phosphate isomerase/epimerase [Candidatus Brocadiia bacterium]
MSGAKIGVIHYNFPGFDMTQFLDYCVRTGFQYIEVSGGDVWNDKTSKPEAEAEALLKELKKRKLKASALSAGNDFVVTDLKEIKTQVKRMDRIAKLANILETKCIRTEGGRPKEHVKQDQLVMTMAECLKRCVDIGEKRDVYFAVDNHGLVTNDGDLQVALFATVGSRRVGANLDTMNYRWAGHDLKTIDHYYDIVAPYTLHTHMKDGTGSLREYKGAALGDGEIHLKYAIKRLKEAGYKGVWCAEYEGPEAAEGVGYAKCCKWLKKNV